ncbi:LysR family transcriptional regulator [Intrasporangium calvum]|uniref:LysR family transcriptional regulator n=1 Tax=Intrasporangium calvum TaxID=53358 RepID=A0ABT5GF03_9MICO|nr:LysR family transcriptional regulator [Intrasporangium calvum]MDC5696818.1 LysR family transcriptional regulator [Intrasporangium calvum]
MDVRQLRYFLAIVDAGGVTRAAEQLFVSQPSLSQALNSLETELGVPLFHRVGRRLVLSEAGRDLIGAARTVLRDLDAARALVDAHRGVRSGRLDLVTMPSPGIEPLASLTASFLREHPGVTLNVGAAFTPEEAVDAIEKGSAEVALVGSREPLHARGLRVVHLDEQPLVLVVARGAAVFDGRTMISRDHLAGQPVVASQRGSLMRWFVDDLAARGTSAHLVVEVAHRTSILPLVDAGVGHAVLPEAWRPLAERLGLVVLPIEPHSVLRISLVHRHSGLTPVATAFLETARRLRNDAANLHI